MAKEKKNPPSLARSCALIFMHGKCAAIGKVVRGSFSACITSHSHTFAFSLYSARTRSQFRGIFFSKNILQPRNLRFRSELFNFSLWPIRASNLPRTFLPPVS